MTGQDFICPLPMAWHRVHQFLTATFSSETKGMAPPPKALILAGWNFSSDTEKAERWTQTVAWARQYGVPENELFVAPNDQYRG
jgi:hypothetical protein